MIRYLLVNVKAPNFYTLTFNNIPEIACVELMPDGNLHKT